MKKKNPLETNTSTDKSLCFHFEPITITETPQSSLLQEKIQNKPKLDEVWFYQHLMK